MKLKSILLAAVLALFTLSMGLAKTYTISFSHAIKAGSVDLKAGDYKLTIDGNKATFTEVKTSQSFTTDVKVETVGKSFSDTRVDASKEDANTIVKGIEVGGSKIKLAF